MKILKSILTLTLLVTLTIACKNDKQPEVKTIDIEVSNKTPDLNPNATFAKAEFTVEGMTCAIGCAKTIEKKIAKMEGVKSAKVDFDKKLAMVEYDVEKVNPDLLEKTVVKTSETYSVKDMKTVTNFSGAKKACDKDCKKACCANKTETEKTACAKDCKKACCAKKTKA